MENRWFEVDAGWMFRGGAVEKESAVRGYVGCVVGIGIGASGMGRGSEVGWENHVLEQRIERRRRG